MGHLLSREGTSLSRERSRCSRRRRGRKVPPRSRSCFLRGPCMLCFIVHGASPPAPEQPLPGRDSPPFCAALSSAEQRAARRLLHLSPAAWEQRGPCQRLLLSGLLPPPVRAFLGSARPPGEPAPDMVCKRKGAGLPACPPCKQPRCGAAAPPEPEAAACQCPSEQQLCPLPCASGRAAGGGGPLPGALSGESGGVGELAAELPPQEKEEEGNDPDRQEPLENPSECCRESLQPPPPDINQLPPSILLKIFSNLSLNERCLSASLVCKYWHDLCLDFHFWKQLDLSNRQQVTDELLEKIASRSQNISEINISDCRNVSDTGVCVLAFKCPGLLRYTAYRCKQLSDTSIIAVASQCPLLQKVHVGNQDRLTDEGLKQLGAKCKELKDVHFGQCYKISDEGMIIIAKGCLKLQRIYMQENKLILEAISEVTGCYHQSQQLLKAVEQGSATFGMRPIGELGWWAGTVCLQLAASAGLTDRSSHWVRFAVPGQWGLRDAAWAKGCVGGCGKQQPNATESIGRGKGGVFLPPTHTKKGCFLLR